MKTDRGASRPGGGISPVHASAHEGVELEDCSVRMAGCDPQWLVAPFCGMQWATRQKLGWGGWLDRVEERKAVAEPKRNAGVNQPRPATTAHGTGLKGMSLSFLALISSLPHVSRRAGSCVA